MYRILPVTFFLLTNFVVQDISALDSIEDQKALRGQVISMARMGLYTEILEDAKTLYRLFKEDREIVQIYLETLFVTENYNEILVVLDEIPNNILDEQYLYEFKARVFDRTKAFDQAINAYKHLYEKGIQRDYKLLFIIAERYSWIGENDKALQYLNNYDEYSDFSNEQRIFYADVLTWNKEYKKAAIEYEKVLASGLVRKDILLKLADALRFDGRDKEAIKVYSQYWKESSDAI